jgi:hypothetical protein
VIAKNRLLPFASLLVPCVLAGCRIETHKNGKNDDVNIGTPFGSMHVKTDDATVVAGLGLTPYPGASFVHKHGDDDGAADVSMSFGSFKLGVHAVDLRTGDPQDKVIAFYRKDMGRYGAVLECRGNQPVGQPSRTAEGLTCTSDHHNGDDDELQLRTGSPVHQHIVGIHSEDGGTRIGLVALDLPNGANHHDSGDRE